MNSVYLDLENPGDLAKLDDPLAFFSLHNEDLVCFDEIQRVPELFTVLRSVHKIKAIFFTMTSVIYQELTSSITCHKRAAFVVRVYAFVLFFFNYLADKEPFKYLCTRLEMSV